jgi:hypothetical protein
MDVVSFGWSRAVSLACRSGVIGLAIAGNPENDGHLSPWQEAVGRVFRGKSAGGSGMKSATDPDLISAIPI